MKFATAAAALAVGASAAPLVARANIDVAILNYALTLEYLESSFYNYTLDPVNGKLKYSDFDAAGYGSWFVNNSREIMNDEATHVNYLASALGSSAVEISSYDFSSITTVAQFIQTAVVLEGVGVSAYLGAANLITSPGYLAVAGSILTVEARHNAYLRSKNKYVTMLKYNGPVPESPFPSPFDIGLNFNQVYTLASPFITSMPPGNGAKLPAGIHPYPALAYTNSTNTPMTGQMISLAPKNAITGTVYAIWIGGPAYPNVMATTYPNKAGTSFNTYIPAGFVGQSYVVLSNSSSTTLTDANTLAGPAVVEVIPAYQGTQMAN